MKYLVLLLLVMFSCNVNAETVQDRINRLTNTEKQNYVNACETDNFGSINNIKSKANVCTVAAFIVVANDRYYQYRQTKVDSRRYIVKSCNYYDLEENQTICEAIYKDYRYYCYEYLDIELCNILKGYYKFY
jgi:hypothetical protein